MLKLNEIIKYDNDHLFTVYLNEYDFDFYRLLIKLIKRSKLKCLTILLYYADESIVNKIVPQGYFCKYPEQNAWYNTACIFESAFTEMVRLYFCECENIRYNEIVLNTYKNALMDTLGKSKYFVKILSNIIPNVNDINDHNINYKIRKMDEIGKKIAFFDINLMSTNSEIFIYIIRNLNDVPSNTILCKILIDYLKKIINTPEILSSNICENDDFVNHFIKLYSLLINKYVSFITLNPEYCSENYEYKLQKLSFKDVDKELLNVTQIIYANKRKNTCSGVQHADNYATNQGVSNWVFNRNKQDIIHKFEEFENLYAQEIMLNDCDLELY